MKYDSKRGEGVPVRGELKHRRQTTVYCRGTDWKVQICVEAGVRGRASSARSCIWAWLIFGNLEVFI